MSTSRAPLFTPTRLWATLGLLVLCGIALAIRLPELGTRLIHADESVHAMRYGEVLDGTYRYDPDEYHGPTLYYAAWPMLVAQGKTDFNEIDIVDYRLLTVIFGVILVCCAPLAMPGGSALAVLVAAALLAFSPILGYYSRYFIQEILLAVFTLAFLGAAYRAARDQALKWLLWAGVFAGLMIATKETASIAFLAAIAAFLVARPGRAAPADKPQWTAGQLLGATGLGAVVAYVLLSSFFSQPSAPFGFLNSLAIWHNRATGGDLHTQPWSYYLQLVAYKSLPRGGTYTEGLILGLALLAALIGWRQRWVRFMAVYSIALIAIYSAIPYKTPWCAVQIIAPLALLAGWGADRLLGLVPRWWWWLPLGAALAFGLFNLYSQSQLINHRLLLSQANPYSHTLTTPDAEELAERIENVARTMPTGLQTMVIVANTDGYYWPLPWHLRRLPNAGWFDHLPTAEELGGDISLAPIVVFSPAYREELEPRLAATHEIAGSFSLRSRVFLMLWVNKKDWSHYLEQRDQFEQDDDW